MNILDNLLNIIRKAEEITQQRKILVLMPFGSHLYGTATKNSDSDYKGIFLSTEKEILTGKIPKHLKFDTKQDNSQKNTNEDIEIELYSLHYFLETAYKGETISIDMLHCPDPFVLITSDEWKYLRENRSKFYTKNLKAFVGYCRKQAAKYGVKGSRLSDAKKVIDFCDKFLFDMCRTIKEMWESLPKGEHIHKLPADEKTPHRMYQICGKKFLETIPLFDMNIILQKFYDNYGHRAKLAEQNQGIDWKAISHAMRAANQLLQIYTIGDIIYPLKCAQYLKDVKQGKVDYLSDASPTLESLIDRVEKLSIDSELPEKVNIKEWEKWLCDTVKSYLT